MTNKLESSYNTNNFDLIFKKICEVVEPKNILEIGILNGYSLDSFINHTNRNTKIEAIDLFENYSYKNSNYERINNKFSKIENVNISYGDFYEYYKNCNHFDLIHIDISNDADVYKFALENYFPLTKKLLILEGGSEERDQVFWMEKYKKPKISKYLKEVKDEYKFQTINLFPSLTIFYPENTQEIKFL